VSGGDKHPARKEERNMNEKMLKILKERRKQLLNSKCETYEDFEQLEDELNEIEATINELENE